MKNLRKLRVGDVVEVRSKEEILRTLDKTGRLEGMPFMPQMFQYCGQRFTVLKRAHKTCDTVNATGGRRVNEAVHLELRCDGKAYGGCQAACLIFWKERWLKPVREDHQPYDYLLRVRNQACTEEDVVNATCIVSQRMGEEPIYQCQATQLPFYTTSLLWRDFGQYFEDFTSGNATLGRLLSGLISRVTHGIIQRSGKLKGAITAGYDAFQLIVGGTPYPRRTGLVPAGKETPTSDLNLQPGDLVRVKSYEAILATVQANGNNHGLSFDPEMVTYCGHVCRVKTRVITFVDENTGKLKTLKNPAVILEGLYCRSCYSTHRMFCPRAMYHWWREIWLERVSESSIV